MCKCTPEIRTPFCGKPGCEWPLQATVVYCKNCGWPEKLHREVGATDNRVAPYDYSLDTCPGFSLKDKHVN